MNIDRDDEYATRYEAAPTIEEQIERIAIKTADSITGCDTDTIRQAIRSALYEYRCAALESQPVPVEPVATVYYAYDTTGIDWHCKHPPAKGAKIYDQPAIDSLQSALRVAQQDRDNCYASLDAARHRLHEITAFVSGDTNKEWESAHSLQVRRAEQAESERRDLKHALAMANRSADDYMIQKREAESRNKRIVELLKEPNANFSDWLESQMPPGTVISNAKWWAPKIQRAMSAELLREVDNGN